MRNCRIQIVKQLFWPMLVLCTGLLGCTKASKAPPPNIVLIMADDADFQHWGCYGGHLPTPGIDRLAEEGMLFDRVYTTAAACTPSRYSLMTGKYPGRCQHPDFITQNPSGQPYTVAWNTPIREADTTLHEVLGAAGYFTGYVGKFHIGSLDFDLREHNTAIPDFPPGLELDSPQADRLLGQYQEVLQEQVKALTGADFASSILWENSEELPVPALRHHHLEWILQGGLRFLETARGQGQPFFLHFNTTALHGPNHYADLKEAAHFSPEGRLDTANIPMPERAAYFRQLDSLGVEHGAEVPDHVNHYNAGILYLDAQIQALLEALDAKGMTEQTVVILTADHNIEPGKSTVYEKGLRVPFVLRWPGQVAPGSRNNTRISFVDLLPTLASLSGQLPTPIETDGLDFSKALLGEQPEHQRPYIYAEEGYTRALSDGRWKYIAMRFPDTLIERLKKGSQTEITHLGKPIHAFGYIAQAYHPGYFAADQLYDLAADPYEQNNLADNPAYTDTLRHMQAALQARVNTFGYPFDLGDTAFVQLPAYQAAAAAVRKRGPGFIPWWNRALDYPPAQH